MDFKANIETRESVEAKAKAALGFDLSSALDLVAGTTSPRMRRIWTLAPTPSWKDRPLNIETPETA